MSKQNPFDQKKKAILEEINSLEPDLSPKGTIDQLCLPIMHLINSHKDMVTTSSCSGRISVFVEGEKLINREEAKSGGKGLGGRWLFVTHEQDKVLNWLDKISDTEQIQFLPADDTTNEFDNSVRYVLYKYEPFILHVKCRDFQMASKLLNVAMSCGFRESGIGSNNIVAIRINIKLDVPIGFINTKNNNTLTFFVSKQYINNILNKLTLSKFIENKKKMNELYATIDKEIISSLNVQSESKETKEERRERKRREGLERQRQLRNKMSDKNA
ncbi:hypothetical protein RI543_000373 [Arxiozyma heterogenica]|uniref:tRNA wybutosine-synthesizing protein 3 n=1 Tax=Arxiozyma heterogenica TaxID=278026 RepID=A0AAN7W6P2_9SACH|nr:hypothetical protein RI543_000373 [Kazachstania heterogenica]